MKQSQLGWVDMFYNTHYFVAIICLWIEEISNIIQLLCIILKKKYIEVLSVIPNQITEMNRLVFF